MNKEDYSAKRRIVATMTRGRSKDVIMVRRYSWFDTAMPRMLQLAMTYCNEGDFVEFASADYGWQLGVLHVRKGGRFDVEMNPLVKHNPSLLKLMTENPDWSNFLINAAMRKAS